MWAICSEQGDRAGRGGTEAHRGAGRSRPPTGRIRGLHAEQSGEAGRARVGEYDR